MKRTILLLCLLTSVVFFATITAVMQGRIRPQLGPRNEGPQRAIDPDALPVNHLNQSQLHKVIINSEDAAAYEQLKLKDAIRGEVDYGSFKLVIVDEVAAGGRAALQTMRVTPSDEQNMIALNGYVLDTSNAQPLSKEIPADLKQSRMAEARSAGYNPSQ